MSSKENKRKLSAFYDTEISRLLAALIDFENKSPGVEIEDDKMIIHLVNKLRDTLSRVKHHPFSSATEETLEKAGIVHVIQNPELLASYDLADPAALAKHAAQFRAMLAKDAFMSADNFEGLFNTIVRHVSTITEAGSRMLVDAFLLRVAAMVEESLVLIFPEYMIPITQLRGPDDTIEVAGKLDYLLVLLSGRHKVKASTLLYNPRHLYDEEARGFAIVEPKSSLYHTLGDALPQAVLEVAALAKKQKKTVMDGVVTNGLMWMFFSFKSGPDGVGGTFERSIQVVASSPDERAVITGVLKDMIERVSTVVRLPVVPKAEEAV